VCFGHDPVLHIPPEYVARKGPAVITGRVDTPAEPEVVIVADFRVQTGTGLYVLIGIAEDFVVVRHAHSALRRGDQEEIGPERIRYGQSVSGAVSLVASEVLADRCLPVHDRCLVFQAPQRLLVYLGKQVGPQPIAKGLRFVTQREHVFGQVVGAFQATVPGWKEPVAVLAVHGVEDVVKRNPVTGYKIVTQIGPDVGDLAVDVGQGGLSLLRAVGPSYFLSV